jgi:ABC-type antimicrobial peptide transport system permease subunit
MNDLDVNLPIFDSMTLVQLRDQITKRERVLAAVLVSFGCVGLLLAGVGIYGMLAYLVKRRTTEIGIRVALGAPKWNVVRMIIRESLISVMTGILIGWAAAAMLARFIEKLLFGVTTNDPLTIFGAALLFMIIASIAAWIPSARAARIDPLRAIRYE